MNGARFTRNPLLLLVTAVIVAVYLYGYASKIHQTRSYSPISIETGSVRF